MYRKYLYFFIYIQIYIYKVNKYSQHCEKLAKIEKKEKINKCGNNRKIKTLSHSKRHNALAKYICKNIYILSRKYIYTDGGERHNNSL